MIRKVVKKVLKKMGYDVLHLPVEPFARQLKHLLSDHDIKNVFDIGANTGQFALSLRSWGFRGRIVSFEPFPDVYNQLRLMAAADKNWDVAGFALGDKDGETVLHVAENSYSSSILESLPRHLDSAPGIDTKYEIVIPVRRIDTIINEYHTPEETLFIKIDTQGFERKIYEGCKLSHDKIKGFYMELSLVPLYKGETLFPEMLEILRNDGYKLVLIDQGHYDYSTGEILQVECVFFANS